MQLKYEREYKKNTENTTEQNEQTIATANLSMNRISQETQMLKKSSQPKRE